MVEMIPMQKAPKISVLPAAGVMATSPATAPVTSTYRSWLLVDNPVDEHPGGGCCSCGDMGYEEGIGCQTDQQPDPLPALNPNHPNQRNDIPMNTKVML